MLATATAQETKVDVDREDADLLAGQLRNMADWLESHPEAATQLMVAEVGRSGPKVVLYSLKALKQAFPGCDAEKQECRDSDVYRLERDGIKFEAWQAASPPKPEIEKVVL